MKKAVAFVLAIVMAISLVACESKKEHKKTENYCSSCGAALTKMGTICERCYTSSEKAKDTTNDHSYSNYVCSDCGQVDKTHAYEFLVMWLKENGTQIEDNYACSLATTEDSLDNLAITYNSSGNFVYLCSAAKINESNHSLMVTLDNYSFKFSVDEDSIIGIVAASKYTESEGDLHVLQSECVNVEPDECVALAKIEVSILLDGLKEFLSDKNWGITLSDLGFAAY